MAEVLEHVESTEEMSQLETEVSEAAAEIGHNNWMKSKTFTDVKSEDGTTQKLLNHDFGFVRNDADKIHPALVEMSTMKSIQQLFDEGEVDLADLRGVLAEDANIQEIANVKKMNIEAYLDKLFDNQTPETIQDWANSISNDWINRNNNWGEKAVDALKRIAGPDYENMLDNPEELSIIITKLEQFERGLQAYGDNKTVQDFVDDLTKTPEEKGALDAETQKLLLQMLIAAHGDWRRISEQAVEGPPMSNNVSRIKDCIADITPPEEHSSVTEVTDRLLNELIDINSLDASKFKEKFMEIKKQFDGNSNLPPEVSYIGMLQLLHILEVYELKHDLATDPNSVTASTKGELLWQLHADANPAIASGALNVLRQRLENLQNTTA